MVRRVRFLGLVLALAFIVVACESDDGGVPLPQDRGFIAGSVSTGAGVQPVAATTRHGLPAARDDLPTPPPPPSHDAFVPGEVVVGFLPGVRAQALAPLAVDGALLEAVRPLAVENATLYRDASLGAEATLAAIERIRSLPHVAYAHPNYRTTATRVPNDEFYGLQWHYRAIDLPSAWAITTGSADIVVAVVDSGILHSFASPSATHPDLDGKVLPGYDFVSSPWLSGDGSGRDPDPYDVGPTSHGTHVAGTIAAATDNRIGVAGVDWAAMLLPVRVLGVDGGTVADMVDGTLWAAGFSVPGVPANPNPAHVINLSLGGMEPHRCSQLEQDAFDRIARASVRDAVVIVAAGNSDADAAQYAPSSCRNVITVGATDALGERAWYSNYGSRIDVMAPGGDLRVDRTGDGRPDGVLSLDREPSTGAFTYRYLEGTSMAAPHVAGVVSLMKSLDPGLTQAQVLTALQDTARPLSAAACRRPTAAACGAGIIDAAAALERVRDDAIPVPGVGSLVFDPGRLDFGTYDGALPVTLRNVGTGSLRWRATRFFDAPDNPSVLPDFAVEISEAEGEIAAGGSQMVTFSIDRSLVSGTGSYRFSVEFVVDGDAVLLPGTFVIAEAGPPILRGPMLVAAFLEGERGALLDSGFQRERRAFERYRFGALAGDNWVVAWSDENDNGVVDAGDYVGVYPAPVRVLPDQTVSGVDIVMRQAVTYSTDARPMGFPVGLAWDDVVRVLEDAAARERDGGHR